ncbi:methionyl-tRNA formyltransferase [Candidatus Uhrbacteria bacterium RIFOXYC2_FULL_47_19]|uniref:Methionyl-tRNA formyltransferase n=1 Tax=Candidatus Uhrbacteria bacterium RIFOXYC2_FULL_47_19 TaxID=1802424 RepID=A0A1F7WCA3_9BACT|nr:MAG: methionyl-tRNA formyltransferase [Candidatus Uhrbacteria bacterium RIFOXYC2_FULL_47_19]
MHIVYFGTADFAVPSLQSLLTHPEVFDVIAVVSQPDRLVGRHQENQSSPVSIVARQSNLLLLQPENIDSSFLKTLHKLQADLFIVAAYGRILPRQVIEMPKLGSINLHGSLLPKYRGASPIQTAILEGETETGVTLILMDEKMDHGPILATTIENIKEDDDYLSLTGRLSEAAAGLLVESLPMLADRTLLPQEQNHELATFTKMIRKEDALINWTTANAWRIERQIRAYRPWPGVRFDWITRNNKKVRTALLRAEIIHANGQTPGTVIETKDGLPAVVVMNDEAVQLIAVQPEGRRAMSGTDFLHGYPPPKLI